MLKIGITGGIGSGKSTICKVFSLLNIPVFNADVEAKQLMNTNPKIKAGLIHLFGKSIYMENGSVDRKKLADIIFNDNLQLSNVNKLVHPVVRKEFNYWVEKQISVYVIHEAAILFESGFYKTMDYTILVTAPREDRIKRIMTRDGNSAKQIEQRMNRQWSDEKKRKQASLEIKNDNTTLIIPQIIELDKNLKTNGKIW